jgi:acylpyruvate hydrolase
VRLVSFSGLAETRLGALISTNGRDVILDLQRATPSLPTEMIAFLEAGDPAIALARVAVRRADERHVVSDPVSLRAPVPRPGKIICVGHNYHGHTGATPPSYPDIFAKFSNVVIGPNEPIVLPSETDQVDYEAELAVVIGRRARHVSEDRALDHVAGYTIFNDVTARDYQKRQSQWTIGKTFDTFGPMGPALVTPDEVGDPGDLDLALWVNGAERQHASTGDLIFTVPFLVAYLSAVMVLEPGDVIATGTPSGTGSSSRPPVYLRSGDEIKIRIEKVGELVNPVAAEAASAARASVALARSRAG